MIPSPTNNHLMDNAPIIGVIIKGKRETKMIGPFRDDNKLLTVKAITSKNDYKWVLLNKKL